MHKLWFNQRAEEGQHYTVNLIVDRGYSFDRWQEIVNVRYEPTQLIHAGRDCIQLYGCMTKEEAIAMAKLLNATKGE